MAWVESRSGYWRVAWREDGRRETEKFPTREQADYYRALVTANGDRRVTLPLPLPASPPLLVVPAAGGAGVSFADFARAWIAQHSGPREKTLARYRTVIERDLIPEFGHLDIAEITRQHDGAWIRKLQAAGVAPKTIKNKHGLMHQILQAAVDFEPRPLRDRNPITAKLPEVIRDEQRFLTHDEFDRLQHAMHEHYRPFIRFLVGTGVRYAEAAGLLVGNVRLLDTPPAVDIRQSWQQQADNTWQLSPLKTRTAKRTIRLAANQLDDLIPLTAPHRNATDFVFTTVRGKPLHHGYFHSAYWTPAVRQAGLDGLRIHDLRHTHVAWLKVGGIASDASFGELRDCCGYWQRVSPAAAAA